MYFHLPSTRIKLLYSCPKTQTYVVDCSPISLLRSSNHLEKPISSTWWRRFISFLAATSIITVLISASTTGLTFAFTFATSFRAGRYTWMCCLFVTTSWYYMETSCPAQPNHDGWSLQAAVAGLELYTVDWLSHWIIWQNRRRYPILCSNIT